MRTILSGSRATTLDESANSGSPVRLTAHNHLSPHANVRQWLTRTSTRGLKAAHRGIGSLDQRGSLETLRLGTRLRWPMRRAWPGERLSRTQSAQPEHHAPGWLPQYVSAAHLDRLHRSKRCATSPQKIRFSRNSFQRSLAESNRTYPYCHLPPRKAETPAI